MAALALTVPIAGAQGLAPSDSAQAPCPTFSQNTGPVVAIDEAHKNTHTFGGPQIRGFVELLQCDGYRVRPFGEAVTGSSLAGVHALVVINPGGWDSPEASLDQAEVEALVRWVHSGGSLLLVLDHMPAPANAQRLIGALGITEWHNGYAMVEVPDDAPVGPIIFWRARFFPAGEPARGRTGPTGGVGYQGPDALLTEHPIVEGRGPSERVRRVATFVGSAFRLPEGAEALMILPSQAVSLVPKTADATDVRKDAERTSVGQWLQGAVVEIGRGRVAVFAEAGLFSGGPAADNRTFVLSVLRWLVGGL